MAERLSRRELYDLVWSQPLRTLSERFGVSDVTLKKTCARAEIPTPDRGYWAKKETGKNTVQVALPERAPGMDDIVVVAGGGNYWYRSWSNEELLGPLPPPPNFLQSIEAVCNRIATVIGKVTVPRDMRVWHPSIDRLFREDDKRREKQLASSYPMSWNNPLFETPFERRRLRILNGLFLAVARMNGKPTIRGHEARDIHLTFHQQHVCIALDRPKQLGHRGHAVTRTPTANGDKLSFSILQGFGSEKVRAAWQDEADATLESRMADIAVQIVLTAEIQHREGAIHQHQWRVERRIQLEEEERKRNVEAERAERERRNRFEQAQIDRLLKDAASFQQAGEIRRYVETLRAAQVANATVSAEEFVQWSEWALAQANRIDPTLRGTFL